MADSHSGKQCLSKKLTGSLLMKTEIHEGFFIWLDRQTDMHTDSQTDRHIEQSWHIKTLSEVSSASYNPFFK
jgi:hypothetical protein